MIIKIRTDTSRADRRKLRSMGVKIPFRRPHNELNHEVVIPDNWTAVHTAVPWPGHTEYFDVAGTWKFRVNHCRGLGEMVEV